MDLAVTATLDAAQPSTDNAPARRSWSYAVIVLVGVAAVGAAVLVSLTIGAVTVSPVDAVKSLFSTAGAGADALVDSRIDRTMIGVLVGASVAVSGAVMQGVTRNPLADPGILGVNAGAALAVILGIYLVGLSSLMQYIWLALVGSAIAAVLVYAIASLGPKASQPVTMALAGAAITAAATSVISGIMVTSQESLDVFRHWQVGSVAGRDPGSVLPVLPFFGVGFVLALGSAAVLNALALGDDMASALGQRVMVGRAVAALGAVLLCSSATAIAGPIAFVGLVVPHAVRLVVGPDYRRVLLASVLAGPVLILLADTIGRIISPPSEVSVGIMTALVGVPVLILLVRRERAR